MCLVRQKRFHTLFMRMAEQWATMSHCRKRQVGCVIVKNNYMLASGFNGTEPGQCNDCEDDQGNTLDHVQHAEINAIAQAKSRAIMLDGTTMYCTLAPCLNCAKALYEEGITTLVWNEKSTKGNAGLDYLSTRISVHHIFNLI